MAKGICCYLLIGMTVLCAWSGNPSDEKGAGANQEKKVVFVTRTGQRYHLASCRYLLSKIETTQKEATSAGYTPCKHCRPSRNQASALDAKPTAADGRCRAMTKKGSRCKRNAKANSYCWQHP